MEISKKIKAKEQIKEFVERFEENISQYKRAHYDEANTRADFIDPFFESLGWDVANKQGYAEQYREVVREAKVIIAGKHKAPDYSFRIGGIRKFFVEAKKPSIALRSEVLPAYQLRRYAYTAKLPLSILTDFEEFSVYDTRVKPTPKDSASCARIFYCGYKDYLKNFDFIYDTFSKEGILRGSFDRYIESTKNKRGTSEVDKEFLKLIDRWREKLAKNIALRNKSLSLYELNFAVQKIVDRIIFLRITEDRQIEDYGKLQILLNGTNTYRRLMEIFLHSDKKYNSGLFDFEKDEITPSLSIDDKVIKEILKSVYYPESPYEFSVLDVEILGNIYEQFLGKTIRLTPAHQVKVEEKPEVKKAGGVYYTPKYIVDYIVKNTVGEIIKGKTLKQIDKIKILDPACGSGSFLLGAYQHLLNYYLDWYSKKENYKKALKKGQIIQTGKDSSQLTITEKKRILLNNIFGVDIDTQAVEVSKLSLLLKLLEGETEESTRQLFRYTQMKLLPDLSNNIKCGNSLIGPDFYDTQQATLFDEAEMRRINVFDWKSAFPDIFQNGGFDVVIGNPPWVSIKGKHKSVDLPEETLKFLFKKYKCDTYMPNMYELFVRRSLAILSKGGFFSFIVPDRLCANQQFITLRKYILENFSVRKLWFKASFPKVIADTVIFVFEKRKRANNLVEVAEYPDDKFIKIPQTAFYETSDYAFFYVNNKIYNIFKKIRSNSSIIQL
ncbi:MAG: N-6 DNA methylase, partial [bacterium]|nr:N-6 DNA methylase [bacterium]